MLKAPLRKAQLILGWMGLAAVLFSISRRLEAAETIVLHLRNGDRLTGELVSEDATRVTIRSGVYGSVSVPLSQVLERKGVGGEAGDANIVETEAPRVDPISDPVARERLEKLAELYKADRITASEYQKQRARILSGEALALNPETAGPTPPPAPPPTTVPAPPPKPVAGERGAVQAAQAAPPAKPPEAPKATGPVDTGTPKPKPPKRWSFDIQLGSNLQYNQVENELYYGSVRVNYTGLKYRNFFEHTVNYGKTDNSVTVNNMNGKWRVERDFNRRLFSFNDLGGGYDEVRRIDLTYEDSFGLGYKLIARPNFTVSTDTGLNYQAQYFADETSKEVFAVRLGERVRWKLSDKLELTESMEVYLRSVDLESYRFRFEAALRYALNSYLNLSLSVLDQYDTEPAPGVTPNDLQVRSTLGVRF
jgi:hypothetical protein